MSMRERWREWREERAEQKAVLDEMSFHIEQETERNLRQGMTPSEARRAASHAFGGVERFAAAARDERPRARWTDFRTSYLDWKLGARMLLKYPGLSVIGGITLATAIGVGVGWFELTLLMVRPELPLAEGDRIVRVENWDAATMEREPRVLHDFHAWREQLTTIGELGAFRTVERNLITPDGARPVEVAEITASAFPLTRVQPLLGRALQREDEAPGAPAVVVLGHRLWQTHFSGDAGIIGRDIRLGRTTATVVGIMPEGFGFPRTHQLWMPLDIARAAPREGPGITVFGRLARGATLESARAELGTVGARAAAAYPETHEHLRPRVYAFASPGDQTTSELVVVNIVGLLLLVAACANVAALMFARTAMRESEILVRNALGASRKRVMAQLFTESLVLTSVAALVGLGAAAVFIRVMLAQFAADRPAPFWYEAGLEPETIAYAAVLAIAAAALVGLLPALRATGVHVQQGIARISSGATSIRFGGVWSGLIVFQVAFSVLCLPFAIAAAGEAVQKRQLRAGFAADGYLTFRPELHADRLHDDFTTPAADAAAERAAAVEELARHLEEDPAVAAVAVAASRPGTYHPLWHVEVQRGAEPPATVQTNIEGGRARVAAVGMNYFETMRLPLSAGRAFHGTDTAAAQPVTVISEALARNIGGNVVGVRIRRTASGSDEPGPWHEVIGVTRDLGLDMHASGPADFLYVPAAAADARYVIVRVNGDAAAFTPALRAAALAVEPDLRLYDVMPLREVIRQEDMSGVLLTLIGMGVVLLAVALSAAGLYALMSVAVARRTREIGIRRAIGASRRGVLAAIFRRAAVQVGVGIVIGNVVAIAALSVMVQELRAGTVLPALLISSAVMALVGVAACLVPGLRALRVQPTEALKEAV